MIKVKKIFSFIIKSALTLVVLLTLVLFFYTVFFFKPSPIEKKIEENKITKEEKILKEKDEEKKLKESKVQEKISDVTQVETEIKQVKTTIEDGLFITVGNRAITKSDIVNEIKIILILNNESYSDDKKEKLHKMAIGSTIERNIKQIEINLNPFLEFNQQDLINETMRLANRINIDLDTLKNIFASNELDFSLLESQIKTKLLWNSLIFHLYKDRLTINVDEIEEQLKAIQNKEKLDEYLISEIIIKPVKKDKLKSEISELKNKIKIEGFENVAMNLSISKSATKGGDLGWINENLISKEYRSKIAETPIGSISEPIFLPEGILIFKVREKRKIKRNIEEEKNQLVNSEKTKILNMHSSSHYDKLKRSIAVKFLNE